MNQSTLAIIIEYYEEKQSFKYLTLIPSSFKYQFPTINKGENSTLKLKVGMIVSISKNQVITPVDHFELDGEFIKIGKRKYHKPICGSGFIIYNEMGEIYLAKNGSQGMLNFIYIVGDLTKRKIVDYSKYLGSIRQSIFAMSKEDKLSVLKMAHDVKEVKKVFKCWMKNCKYNQANALKYKIDEIAQSFETELNQELEDPQECNFQNYSFIKGGLNGRELKHKKFTSLNDLYLENAVIEFEQELENKKSDIIQNSNKDFVDFRFFSFETRHSFEEIPLFYRFFFVKCRNNPKVKTLEYSAETSKFYAINQDSNTWEELPKFMRESVSYYVDNLIASSLSQTTSL